MFNITAQLVLNSPNNIKPILNGIRQELKNLPAIQINAKVSPTAQAEIAKLTTSLRQLQTTATSSANAVKTMSPGQGLSNVSSHFNTANRSAQTFGNSIELAGRRMMAYASFSAPMLASLKALHTAYDSFNEMQQISVNLAQVNSVSLTDAIVTRMENQVRRITSSHGSNTKDVYNAVANLSQAGIPEKQISASVGTLSSLSMNKQVENFKDVSDGYILLSQSFKMNSPQIEKAFSMMVHNSKVTASEFSGLLEALKRGGSIFQTTGQDLNTLVASFSYLREKTRLEPEVVQTGLNSVVSNLFSDKRITELMRTKLGVEVFTATGNVRNLIDVLEELGAKLKGMPQEQSLPIIKELFGKKQNKVGTALLENIGDGRLRELYNIALRNSNDIMKDQAVAAESLQGKLNKVRNEWAMASADMIHSKGFTSATDNILAMTSSLVRLATTLSQLTPVFAGIGGMLALGAMVKFPRGGVMPGGKATTFTDVWKPESNIDRQIKMRQKGNVPMMLDKDVPEAYRTNNSDIQWYRDNSVRAKIGRLNQRGGYALSGGMALAGQFVSGANPDSPHLQAAGTGMTMLGGMMMMGITNPLVLAIGTAVTSLTAWNNALEDSARKMALNMGAESLRKYNMSGDRTSPDSVKLLYDAMKQQQQGIMQSGEQPGFLSTLFGGLGKAFSNKGADWYTTADTIASERKQEVIVRSSDVYSPIINYEVDRLANKSKTLKEFEAKPETKQLMDFAHELGMNTKELREAGKKIIDLKNAVQKKQELVVHLDDVKQKIFAGNADIFDKTQSMNKVRNINISRVPVSEGLQTWGTIEATKSLKRLNVDESTMDINRVLGAIPKIRGGEYGNAKTSEEALLKSSKVDEIQTVIKAIIDSTDGLENQIKAIEGAFAERVIAINKVGEQVDRNYQMNMENLISMYTHKAELQSGRLNIARSNIGFAELKQSYKETPGVPIAGLGNTAIQQAVDNESVQDISGKMAKAFNAFKATGDDKYKVVFDNLGKNLQLLGNSQDRLRGEIEKLNYFERAKQAKLGLVEQWTTSDMQGRMELGRGVGLAQQAVAANDLTRFTPMDQAQIISILGSALKDIPNVFGTNKTGENLKNDLLKTLPGVAKFVGPEQQGIDKTKKTIEVVMTDSIAAQQELQAREEQMFVELTTRIDFNNNKFLAGLQTLFEPVKPIGRATGGFIRSAYNTGGNILPASDTIPAMLTPGEFVIRKEAVDQFGIDKLEQINSLGFAKGGRVNAQEYKQIMNDRKLANAGDKANRRDNYFATKEALRDNENEFRDAYKTRNDSNRNDKLLKLIAMRNEALEKNAMGKVERLDRQIENRRNTLFDLPRVGEPVSLFNQGPIKRITANALTSGKPDERPIDRTNRIHAAVVANKASLGMDTSQEDKYNELHNTAFVKSMSSHMNIGSTTPEFKQDTSKSVATMGGGLTQRPEGETTEERKARIHAAVVANRGYADGGLAEKPSLHSLTQSYTKPGYKLNLNVRPQTKVDTDKVMKSNNISKSQDVQNLSISNADFIRMHGKSPHPSTQYPSSMKGYADGGIIKNEKPSLHELTKSYNRPGYNVNLNVKPHTKVDTDKVMKSNTIPKTQNVQNMSISTPDFIKMHGGKANMNAPFPSSMRGYANGGIVRGYASGGQVTSGGSFDVSGLNTFYQNFDNAVGRLAQIKFPEIPHNIKIEMAPANMAVTVTGESALAKAIVDSVREYVSQVVDQSLRNVIDSNTGETRGMGPARPLGGQYK